MRKEFLQVAQELEEHDLWFRDLLSKKTTIATEEESWSVTRDVAEKLYELVLQYKPKHILEIGTSLGYSTIWLAQAALEYGGQVDTIEIELGKIEKAQQTFDRLGFDNVHIYNADSVELLKKWDKPVDFLFLDARKREYITQLKLLEPHLSDNAIVVADDVSEWRRKLDEFFDYLDSSKDYDYEVLPLGHGLLVASRKN